MKLLLKDCVLLDCKTNYKKKDVLIRDEIIELIDDFIPASKAEKVIDLNFHTLMPCFVDCHVHVCSRAGPSEQLLRNFAHNGISTVKDMGLLNNMALEPYMQWLAMRQTPEFARVVTAGRYIDVENGYGMGPGKGDCWGIEIKNSRDVENAVAYQAKLGVHGIKTGLSDGFVGSIRNKISADLMRALTTAARTRGLWSSAHIGRVDDLRLIVECGFTAAAHTPGDREMDDSLIDMMVAHEVPMTTTVGNFMVSEVPFVPKGYKDATDLKMHQAIMLRNLQKFYQAGGVIGVGTDRSDRAGSRTTSIIPIWELAQLRSIGLPMHEVIKAGTINSATICNITDEGIIEVGKKANLLAFYGELDDSFVQLKQPPLVINRGQILVNLIRDSSSEKSNDGERSTR